VLTCRVALPGGEQSVLGEHQSAVRCVQHVASRGLLVTGSWDQVCAMGRDGMSSGTSRTPHSTSNTSSTVTRHSKWRWGFRKHGSGALS
jgi:hypothetical protein